ncbi:MAG: radical SAM family heme chaperone HemW [Candidatus Kapaibacterium sp.]
MLRGLYIHIPFCATICSYCDFYIIKNQDTYIEKYVEYLLMEFEIFKSLHSTEIIIDNIFLGGGTPSLLSPSQLATIIHKVKECFEVLPNAEISMESNPASIDKLKLYEYKSVGINRISIGVQSFVKKELGILKRNHSPKLAEKIVSDAVKSGIETVNLDLIFSIPGQSLASWTYSIEKALDLGTNHFSTYNLTFEENTPLWNKMQTGKVVKYNDEVDEFMYFTAIEILTKYGFDHYEISNFAKFNNKCRHNLNTWNSGEYLAFGVSSHGFFEGSRYKNISNLQIYYEMISNGKLPIIDSEKLNDSDYSEELIVLGLRATGLNKAKIEKQMPLFFEKSQLFIEELLKKEFITDSNTHFKLTSKGYALCDSITSKFLNFL